jgi:ribosomal protein S18 acetylase RimI-like enzyme
MHSFTNTHITTAAIADITDINNLLNNAYRGETSKQGWTTEAFLIEGDARTDENNLKQIMQLPGSVFLKYTNEMQEIIGCVNLQQHEYKLYLGMFAVAPFLQGGGIGKQLLLASEEYAKQLQCKSIYMSVISLRKELINWYQRHGYSDTGERNFFEEDGLTGKHVQPLEFMILEKIIP